MASRGVNLVCACEPACLRPNSRDVLIPLPGDRCVRAEYLVPTPRLTDVLCARGDVVISARDGLCAPTAPARD